MRTTNKYILFWGSPFSNFYPYETKLIRTEDVQPLNFEFNGIKWRTSEQCFMYQKAMFFNDIEIANKIITSIRPEDAKRLGRKVKNFDTDKWSQVSDEMMFNAVYAKFSQNDELKKLILSDEFENKHFVEASPLDKIWGIGLHYNDKKCDNEKNWLGENKLGKVLDRVREKIKEMK